MEGTREWRVECAHCSLLSTSGTAAALLAHAAAGYKRAFLFLATQGNMVKPRQCVTSFRIT